MGLKSGGTFADVIGEHRKMVSLRNSLTDLERAHESRDLALDCYRTAIQNLAQYVIEFDEQVAAQHRKYVEALAEELATGTREALIESKATVRGLLRDYRDKATEYLRGLRDELAGTARALQEILDAISQSDGDHEIRLRKALVQLRAISDGATAEPIRQAVHA